MNKQKYRNQFITHGPLEIQNFTKEERNKVIKKCKEQGLSIRQIARLTGVSFGIIREV